MSAKDISFITVIQSSHIPTRSVYQTRDRSSTLPLLLVSGMAALGTEIMGELAASLERTVWVALRALSVIAIRVLDVKHTPSSASAFWV